MPRSWVEEGLASFGGMATFLRDDAPAVFADVKDAQLQSAFNSANAAAVAALGDLASWFESLRANATDDYAIGPELFAEMLRRTEGVDVPAEKIAMIGRADLDRNLLALDEACREFAPGQDRPGCMAKMNANRPEGGALATARRQLEVLKPFLVEHRLVSIPSDDPVQVEQAPPYKATNFAYIMTAGPYDVGMPSTYYISPPDPSWPEAEQRAYTPGVADLMSLFPFCLRAKEVGNVGMETGTSRPHGSVPGCGDSSLDGLVGRSGIDRGGPGVPRMPRGTRSVLHVPERRTPGCLHRRLQVHSVHAPVPGLHGLSRGVLCSGASRTLVPEP